jgi:curli production assembly/transport component CsgG
MKKLLLPLLVVGLMSGCAVQQKLSDPIKPEVAKNNMSAELNSIPAPANGKLTVAVYQFMDKTGQRKSTPGIASFSTAVTQGAEGLLIRALQDVGNGQWFDVVERTNIDDLTKERLIIKQMRDAYEGPNAQKLMPLSFAGIIIEGGIIGYDTGLESGGTGYNWLGIGPSTQYSKDIVTISLRAVSVNTGKVLATVTVTKIVYSTSDTVAIFKSIDPNGGSILSQVFAKNTGSQAATAGIFQFESGIVINEATTLALKSCIESSVVELIKEGERKKIWDYKTTEPVAQMAPVVVKLTPVVTAPEVISEPEKKVEVKQPEDMAAKEGVAPPAVATIKAKAEEDQKVLNKLSYLFAKPDDAAQKRWQLPAGTKVTVIPKENGWYFVDDGNKHKGYVQGNNLNE